MYGSLAKWPDSAIITHRSLIHAKVKVVQPWKWIGKWKFSMGTLLKVTSMTELLSTLMKVFWWLRCNPPCINSFEWTTSSHVEILHPSCCPMLKGRFLKYDSARLHYHLIPTSRDHTKQFMALCISSFVYLVTGNFSLISGAALCHYRFSHKWSKDGSMLKWSNPVIYAKAR